MFQGSKVKLNIGARRPGTIIPCGDTYIRSYYIGSYYIRSYYHCMVSFSGNAGNFSTSNWGREENNISSHNAPVLS